MFSSAGVNRLARTLYACLRDRAITLPDVPELLDELSGVRLVEVGPGLLRLDHRHDQHDDQAVAVAMVATHLLDRPTGQLRLTVPTGRIPQRERPLTALAASSGPPVPVVKPGEVAERERGPVRLGPRFNPSRLAGYRPPGSR